MRFIDAVQTTKTAANLYVQVNTCVGTYKMNYLKGGCPDV